MSAALLIAAVPALAQQPRPAETRIGMDAAALARAVQNPLARMLSLPVQNDTNLGYGAGDGVQNVMNLQPVVPVALDAAWNLILRPVLPVIWQPAPGPDAGTTFGLGATQTQFFLTPSNPGRLIWGTGVVAQAPTTTEAALGSNRWGAGPGLIALTLQGPWVIGGVANNVWSFGGDGPNRYSTLTLQPLVSYNIPALPGTYLSFSPIVTAQWEARDGNVWTVPVGLALGQIFHLGRQPVNAQLGAYYNAIRPDDGPDWQIRFQIALLFPK